MMLPNGLMVSVQGLVQHHCKLLGQICQYRNDIANENNLQYHISIANNGCAINVAMSNRNAINFKNLNELKS